MPVRKHGVPQIFVRLGFEVDILEDSRKTPLNTGKPHVVNGSSEYDVTIPCRHRTRSEYQHLGIRNHRAKTRYSRKATSLRSRKLSLPMVEERSSFDLALDLVLNEVVEQARLATGATGAAVALTRNGEMVCRATTGADAPDLGVRIATRSGLSGACLQTGEIQQCSDAESDPRVNTEVSRRLKSILVLPLTDGKEPFGILEVFSSRKNAFGDRDINTLQVLVRRIIDSKRGAESVTAAFLTTPADEVHESGIANPEVGQTTRPRRTDPLTYVLGVPVIMVAVGLGLLLGWRGAIVWGFRGAAPERRVVAVVQADHPADSGHQQEPRSTSATDSTPSSKDGSMSQPGPSATPLLDRSNDALVVSQNGKVIYRSRPL